jgi:hypothetical protein
MQYDLRRDHDEAARVGLVRRADDLLRPGLRRADLPAPGSRQFGR